MGASQAQNQSRKRAAKNKSPDDLVASRAAAAASKNARRKRIRRDLSPGDLVASKATAAAAEKVRWKHVQEYLAPGDLVAPKLPQLQRNKRGGGAFRRIRPKVTWWLQKLL